MCIPRSIVASFTHDIFIKGCQINFSMDRPTDIEVTDLYPNTPFRTLDDCFNDFAVKMLNEVDVSVLVHKPNEVDVSVLVHKPKKNDDGVVVSNPRTEPLALCA